MIISRTPLRISFVGGGSDISSFYRTEPGAVVSTSIAKYVYVTINKRFDGNFRLSYTDTETVSSVNEITHNIARETLKFLQIDHGIEVHSIGDIPAKTGLASSGAYTVGLLNALATYQGRKLSAQQLAEMASVIEIEKVGRPIGKQDQYAEAYGGLNYIQFNPDDSVIVEPIRLSAQKLNKLQSQLLLFYTGKTSSSTDVLAQQTKELAKHVDKRKITSQMVRLAKELQEQLMQGNITSFGELLHKNWLLKKQMSAGISSPQIDQWYETAMKHGALGGKICGAGGRGFLLFFAPTSCHAKIKGSLPELQHIDFTFEKTGSKIIYND